MNFKKVVSSMAVMSMLITTGSLGYVDATNSVSDSSYGSGYIVSDEADNDFPLKYTQEGKTSEGKNIYESRTNLSYSGCNGKKSIILYRNNKSVKSVTHSNLIVKHKIIDNGVKFYVKTANSAVDEKQSSIYGVDQAKIKYTDGTIDVVYFSVAHEVDRRSSVRYIIPSYTTSNFITFYKSGKTVKQAKVLGSNDKNKFNITYHYNNDQSESDKKYKRYGFVKIKANNNLVNQVKSYGETSDIVVEYTDGYFEIYKICIAKEDSYKLNSLNGGETTIKLRSDKYFKSLNYSTKKLKLTQNKNGVIRFKAAQEDVNVYTDVSIYYTDGTMDIAHVKLYRSTSSSYKLNINNEGVLKKALNKSKVKSISVDKPSLMEVSISNDKMSIIGKPKASGLCAVAVNYENGDKEVLRLTLYKDVVTTQKLKEGNSFLYKNTSDRNIVGINSTDTNIAAILKAENGYYVNAKKQGSCTINIKYSNSDIETVRLTVEPSISADKVVWVGDSRTVGMNTTYNNSLTVVAKVAMGYNWMVQNKSSFINKRGYNIVFNMGVNDLYNINKYIEFYNSLPDEFLKENNVYFMSVNPVDEIKQLSYGYNSSNSSIANFNSQIKSKLNSKIKYIDSYNYMISKGFQTVDGIHYDSKTYKMIHDYAVSQFK